MPYYWSLKDIGLVLHIYINVYISYAEEVKVTISLHYSKVRGIFLAFCWKLRGKYRALCTKSPWDCRWHRDHILDRTVLVLYCSHRILQQVLICQPPVRAGIVPRKRRIIFSAVFSCEACLLIYRWIGEGTCFFSSIHASTWYYVECNELHRVIPEKAAKEGRCDIGCGKTKHTAKEPWAKPRAA